MTPNKPEVCVVISHEPPSPAQLASWDWLWTRLLLGHVEPGAETPQPQDHVGTGAATVATVNGGHDIVSEQDNDNRFDPHSK